MELSPEWKLPPQTETNLISKVFPVLNVKSQTCKSETDIFRIILKFPSHLWMKGVIEMEEKTFLIKGPTVDIASIESVLLSDLVKQELDDGYIVPMFWRTMQLLSTETGQPAFYMYCDDFNNSKTSCLLSASVIHTSMEYQAVMSYRYIMGIPFGEGDIVQHKTKGTIYSFNEKLGSESVRPSKLNPLMKERLIKWKSYFMSTSRALVLLKDSGMSIHKIIDKIDELISLC
jgi:hypothetical protein